jgi:hypothetical protein
MILLALIGCIYMGEFISDSHIVYWVKWQLAKYKIRYNKTNVTMPIGTQLLPLKPFDCKYCLSFWFSLIVMLSSYNIFIALPTAFLIYKLSKILLK